MTILFIFCSQFELFDWLQNHLLSCPFKSLTGIDCPGCGFQRSVLSLLQGDLSKSWALYPPTIPLIILFSSYALLSWFPLKHNSLILKSLVVITGNFVLISYFIKMFAIK